MSLSRFIFPLFLLCQLPLAAADTVSVRLQGLSEDLANSVNAAMSLARQQHEQALSAARIQALYRRAPEEITSALQSFGYYQATVAAHMEELGSEGSGQWQARFEVDAGAALRISRVDIKLLGEGGMAPAMGKTVAEFPLGVGDVLNHSLYEAGKTAIENAALDKGYFDGRWQVKRIEIDRERYQAALILHFEPGQRYRFGAVSLPDSVIEEALLRQLISVREGEPYDTARLIESRQRLRDSQYFNAITLTPLLNEEAEKAVPVRVELEAQPRNAYSVGAGYRSDTGPRLVAAWDSRYFNDRGHRIETDLQLSEVNSSLTGTYLIPYYGGSKNGTPNTEFGITSALSREETDTRISDKFEFGVNRLRKLGDWHQTMTLTYQFENFSIADSDQSSHLLIPGIGYWRSKADDPIFPRRGYKVSVDLRGAWEGLVADVSFAQVIASGKLILPVGENNRLLLRGQFGSSWVGEFSELPASMRFYAGGDLSVRGFDYESLGPKDATGEVIGGQYLLVGSVEYEQRLTGNWSGAIFVDAGNAMDDTDTELVRSAGLGLRWRSPVGMIRMDLAEGLNVDDSELMFHFIVGPDL